MFYCFGVCYISVDLISFSVCSDTQHYARAYWLILDVVFPLGFFCYDLKCINSLYNVYRKCAHGIHLVKHEMYTDGTR